MVVKKIGDRGLGIVRDTEETVHTFSQRGKRGG
jgi:hypothetical protein